MKTVLRWLFYFLLALFCFAYPFAVIGVAFNVRPPFSMDWAGSALLFIEGCVLIVAAMQLYGVLRAILVGLTVIVLSYAVEALGVNTGFPFGLYRYTPILFPRLVGGVPLAVMFAWVLIVFGAYGWVAKGKGRIGLRGALLGALLAMLLDFVIEPVAFHVVNYWQWLQPGTFNYYGVPFANFGAWFIVAFLLLLSADTFFSSPSKQACRGGMEGREDLGSYPGNPTLSSPKTAPLPSPPMPTSPTQNISERETLLPYIRIQSKTGITLAHQAPKLLFTASLFMFGLVDFTHGYALAAFIALATGGLLTLLRPSPLPQKQSPFFRRIS